MMAKKPVKPPRKHVRTAPAPAKPLTAADQAELHRKALENA